MFAFQQRGWEQKGQSAMLKQAIPTVQGNSESLLSAYIRTRRRAFNPQSPLRPFVEVVLQDQALNQIRSRMAIMWVLNRILWDLRYHYGDSIQFLDRLYFLVASANYADLKPITLLFMIVDCVARLGTDYTKQNHNITDIIVGRGYGDGRIMWWWETVEAVELRLLMSQGSRNKILQVLSAELVENHINEEALTEPFLVDLANEIRLSWMYKDLNRSGGMDGDFA